MKLAKPLRKPYDLRMQPIRAVITGDFVGSRLASPDALESAMDLARNTADCVALEEGFNTRFTRFRGDGWQIYLETPGICLRTAFRISARLRSAGPGLVTRQSIGIGPVARLPDKDLAAAAGDAFEASGLGLDHMDRHRRIAVSGRGHVTEWQSAVIALADWHCARWSREQAEAIALRLQREADTNSDLADSLGISRQAFEARLAACGWSAWQQMLWVFDNSWAAHG